MSIVICKTGAYPGHVTALSLKLPTETAVKRRILARRVAKAAYNRPQCSYCCCCCCWELRFCWLQWLI